MTSISNPAFDRTTEALQVASHFPESIKDRVILVTGVNKRGIGFTTAEAFAAQHPRTLILAGRSEIKIRECVEALGSWYPTVDIRPLLVDLSSQKSVRSAAATVLGWTDMPVVDVVINNAGIMRHGEGFDGPMPTSEDGIEDQFATNHLGHFLLTNLIMPKIIAGATATTRAGGPTASSRIINISSSGTYLSPFRASDLGWQKPASQLPESERPNFTLMKNAGMQVDEDVAYVPTAAYGQSKTCNVLFSVGLNERLFAKYSILSLAAHPGDIKTELARYTDPDWLARAVKNQESAGLKHWKTQTQGASTTLVAACDPKLALPGSDAKGYFIADCQISRAPAYATHREEAEKLWRISEELVGEKFVL